MPLATQRSTPIPRHCPAYYNTNAGYKFSTHESELVCII